MRECYEKHYEDHTRITQEAVRGWHETLYEDHTRSNTRIQRNATPGLLETLHEDHTRSDTRITRESIRGSHEKRYEERNDKRYNERHLTTVHDDTNSYNHSSRVSKANYHSTITPWLQNRVTSWFSIAATIAEQTVASRAITLTQYCISTVCIFTESGDTEA